MCGKKKFRLFGCHVAQCFGPFKWVALNFLWVAGIGEIPNEEVACHNPFLVGNPCPQVVVGFANGVVEFYRMVADVEDVLLAERFLYF